MDGGAACRPMRVVGRMALSGPCKSSFPDLFRAQDGVRDGERLAARPGTRWYAAETGAGVTLGGEVEFRDGCGSRR